MDPKVRRPGLLAQIPWFLKTPNQEPRVPASSGGRRSALDPPVPVAKEKAVGFTPQALVADEILQAIIHPRALDILDGWPGIVGWCIASSSVNTLISEMF